MIMIISKRADLGRKKLASSSLRAPSSLLQFPLSVLAFILGYLSRISSLHFDSIAVSKRVPRAGRELDGIRFLGRADDDARFSGDLAACACASGAPRFDRADNVDLSNAVPLTIDKRQAARISSQLAADLFLGGDEKKRVNG